MNSLRSAIALAAIVQMLCAVESVLECDAQRKVVVAELHSGQRRINHQCLALFKIVHESYSQGPVQHNQSVIEAHMQHQDMRRFSMRVVHIALQALWQGRQPAGKFLLQGRVLASARLIDGV